MEKLEKLENLYQEFWEDEFKKNGMHNPAKFIDTQPFMYRSKELGFIKWLVDNDKIDESKIEIHWFSFYESVLMELAIQDEPIEFLISILK